MIKTHTTLNQYLGFYTFIKPWFKFVSSLKRSHCCCSVAQSCPTLWDPVISVGQASLSLIISWSLLKLISIELMMPSNHLIFCLPLLLLPSIFPTISVFPNQRTLCISFFPMNMGWFSLGLTALISLQSKELSRVFSSTAVQKYQFFGTLPSLWSNSHIHTWLLECHSFDYTDLGLQTDVSVI